MKPRFAPFMLIPLLLIPVLTTPALAGEDHPVREMMTTPAEVTTRDRMLEQEEAKTTRRLDRETLMERFRAEHPEGIRVAFYYNRRFSERISDWVASERVAIGGTHDHREQSPEGERSGSERDAVAIQRERSRGAPVRARAPDTELQGGYLAVLRDAGVQLLEPDMVMRLTDASLEDGTFTRGAPDHRRLEMRALSEHADVLVELEALERVREGEEARFRMRVMDVAEGSLLGVLETGAEPPEEEYPFQWVATERGFQRDRPPLTLARMGDELGLITLEQLLRDR